MTDPLAMPCGTDEQDEILQTGRLILRYMRTGDISPLTDLWTDPAVTEHMGGPREKTSLVSNLGLTARSPRAEKYDLWILVEQKSGAVIGHCGIIDKEVDGKKEVELVYVLARSAWGKGYATEIAAGLRDWAFAECGLKRLISLIEPSNARSERVAQKIGMRLEREIVRPGGHIRRVYVSENR